MEDKWEGEEVGRKGRLVDKREKGGVRGKEGEG